MNSEHPLARKDKLVVREVADEVLIYDLGRDKAFCLNRLAGAVWKLSDGTKAASQIADELSEQLGATVEEKAVWAAIEQLGRDHLLEYCISTPIKSGMTRRQQLKSLGKAAAIAGPVVAALAVPKSAAAASCIQQNKSCAGIGDPSCCRGLTCKQNKKNGVFVCG